MLKRVRVCSRALQKAEHACKGAAVISEQFCIVVALSDHMFKAVGEKVAGNSNDIW